MRPLGEGRESDASARSGNCGVAGVLLYTEYIGVFARKWYVLIVALLIAKIQRSTVAISFIDFQQLKTKSTKEKNGYKLSIE